MEFQNVAMNQTVHAEQCTLSNVYLHTAFGQNEKIRILAVSEVPCGHCRQILQELPDAKNIRVIVQKAGVDHLLSDLLPYSFELPIDGIVHHLFETASLFPLDQFETPCQSHLRRIRSEIEQHAISLTEDRWNRIESRLLDLLRRSFAWYSGHASSAVILSKTGDAFGGCVESSAYNPTINPLQMALIDCELKGIEFESVEAILLVEMDGKAASYEGFLRELGEKLIGREIPVFYVVVKANLGVC